METYEMLVTAQSNPDLEPERWNQQVAMVKQVLDFDPATKTWWGRIGSAHAERLTRVLNTLFDAAREYGITVAVEMEPAQQADGPAAQR
jgi:sugar phosphate isomerase/epimerase